MHAIVDTLTTVHTALDAAVDAQAIYLSLPEKRDALREVERAEARLGALKLKVLAAAGDVAAESGAKTAGSWLAGDQRLDPRAARASQRLATALERWIATAAALAAGEVNLDQARVITSVLEEITDDLDTEQLAEAEATLLREAKRLDPGQLRRLGRHLADIVDPEAAEEREARRLADEERHAEQKARLSLKPLGDGTTRISGRVPDAVGQRLRTCLEAFAQPRKQALAADGKRLPRPKLLARALRDLLERLDPDLMPFHGGAPTTVMVTITLDQLRTELARGGVVYDDDDHPMTAGQLRRLLCEAEIIPVVLGGKSTPLDVGRAKRFHNVMQRRVICLHHRTCKAAGCDVPSRWCHIHHVQPWSQGGRTSVKDGIPLCPHHHTLIHDATYDHEPNLDGDIIFHRRT